MVTYSAKAFLPIYALAVGRNTLEAGLFFTVQQAVTMVAKPLFGWIGDRWSHIYTILLAIFGMASALVMLTFSANVIYFYLAAIILGLAEALIIPSTTALVAKQLNQENIGAGLGIIGTLQNASKFFGPILAGLLISITSYELAFQLMAGFILCSGIVIFMRKSALG